MAHSSVVPDQLLLLLKSAHLQRLARFALIDGVPVTFGKRSKGHDAGSPALDLNEEA